MRKLSKILLALVIFASSCMNDEDIKKIENQNVQHQSQDLRATDIQGFEGIYTGILPCADCEGIQTIITLNQQSEFTIATIYLGKNDSTKHTEHGIFTFRKEIKQIILPLKEGRSIRLKVGKNQLIQLDQDGNTITGNLASNYILKKLE